MPNNCVNQVNNFNKDISQSVCQEITSLNYFQYNNNMFQGVQNVIRRLQSMLWKL